jgi:hypothetical protein
MRVIVCFGANALGYPLGGGHLSVYLNWALGLRAAGCEVIWLEMAEEPVFVTELLANVATLKGRLERFGLQDSLRVRSETGAPLPAAVREQHPGIDDIIEADLFLSLRYATRPELAGRFRKTALVDIDPGLLQSWLTKGAIDVPDYNVHFTIGETVGQPGACFPDGSRKWEYTPPCVALDWWVPCPISAADAPFSTISHWHAHEWMEDGGRVYANDKRTAFLPFLDLPSKTNQPLELAICLAEEDQSEWQMLRERGWRVLHAYKVAATPWDYQRYIQGARGEFSCTKPAYVRLQTAWISDRTLCYLASGKPAIVQHTGPSRFLPETAGLFRFRDIDEAARHLDTAAADYEKQCKLARTLVEEYFDARKVVTRILERVLS